MKNNHISLDEAMKIHHYALAHKRIGIHFGAYVLSFIFLNEPITQIKSSIMLNDLNPLEFIILKVGEVILI